jgi:hypothetical protein
MVSTLAPVGSLQSSILTLTIYPISPIGCKPICNLKTQGRSRETPKEIGEKYKVSSRLQSSPPSSISRIAKSHSASGQAFIKRPPCIREHMETYVKTK